MKKHKPSKKKALNNENNECWLFLQVSVSSLAAKVLLMTTEQNLGATNLQHIYFPFA
jgi:hypothetical protein